MSKISSEVIQVKEWIERNTPPKNIVRALNVTKARHVVAFQESMLTKQLLYLFRRRQALGVPLVGGKLVLAPPAGGSTDAEPNR